MSQFNKYYAQVAPYQKIRQQLEKRERDELRRSELDYKPDCEERQSYSLHRYYANRGSRGVCK